MHPLEKFMTEFCRAKNIPLFPQMQPSLFIVINAPSLEWTYTLLKVFWRQSHHALHFICARTGPETCTIYHYYQVTKIHIPTLNSIVYIKYTPLCDGCNTVRRQQTARHILCQISELHIVTIFIHVDINIDFPMYILIF